MGSPDRSLGAAVAALSRRWRALVIFIYLVLIPAAIIYAATQARNGLRNDDRQDAFIQAQIARNRMFARQNCERSQALLNYFILANDVATRAGSRYAVSTRPLLNDLILDFDRIGDCPVKP